MPAEDRKILPEARISPLAPTTVPDARDIERATSGVTAAGIPVVVVVVVAAESFAT